MRILHVTHELPPYETAGTAIYTQNIARAQARDHDVFIFARLQDPNQDPYRLHSEHRDELSIRFMNLADLTWSPFEESYRDPKAEKIFRDYLEEVAPDVVHFQHVLGFGVGLLEITKALGIPTVFTLHDFWSMCPMGQRMCYTDETLCEPIDFSKCGRCCFGEGWKDPSPDQPDIPKASSEGPTFRELYWRRYQETPGYFARRPRALLWAKRHLPQMRREQAATGRAAFASNPFEHRFRLLREALLGVDLIITPSAFLRDQFMKHMGFSPEKIIHSANGMDFSYVKTLEKTPASRLRVGFVGSIIRTKGVHVVLRGFLLAAERQQNLELHIHGAPNRWSQDYLKELKEEASAHPHGSKVFFHGRFQNRRIGEVLAEIDLLCLPSIWFENAPLTLNEAAMTGTPIVVSDKGGMLEFVTANDYGRTFTLGSPESLATVLEELARDPARLQALAGSPPPIKSVGANAQELTGIYRELTLGSYKAPSLHEQAESRGGVLLEL